MNFLPSRAEGLLPELAIGDKKAKIPIVQGGMGVGVSLSRLASAVARQGAIGVVAANAIGMIEPDYYQNHIEANMRALRSELRKCRESGDGLIGVNIMVAVDCFRQLIDVSVEEGVDFLFLGAGLPVKDIPVKEIREKGIQVVPIVSSARTARIIFKMWEKNYRDVPDAVVVEGPEAGGHLGFSSEQIDDPAYRLEKIVPEVLEALEPFKARWDREIPLIAAGGIYNGEDIFRILRLGASGVQMGTRFVATNECDVDVRFKEAYVNCRKEDIRIISSPVGMPGRAIASSFLDEVASGIRKVFMCPSRCLASCKATKARYCISEALDNARKGDFSRGFAFCGANAYRVDSVVPVKQLINSLRFEYFIESVISAVKAEYEDTAEKLRQLREDYSPAFPNFPEAGERRFRESVEAFNNRMTSLRAEYEKMVNSVGVSLLEELESMD